MNMLLNENWRTLLDELQSSFEEAIGFAFTGITQQFFNRVPLNSIFLY